MNTLVERRRPPGSTGFGGSRMAYKEFVQQSDFDSRIIPSFASADPRYFGFVIILRVGLKQLNPPKGRNRFTTRDASNVPRVGICWDHVSWAHFKQDFVRVVLATWDGAFLLTPPDSYNEFIWPEQGAAGVICCAVCSSS